jgi:hypothetical protein
MRQLDCSPADRFGSQLTFRHVVAACLILLGGSLGID